MAEFPAFPLFTDAYLADTLHLTTEEHGVYLILLMMAWRTSDASIPNDDAWIVNVCKLHGNKWRKMKPTITAFWHAKGGRLYQKRLQAEREFVQETSKKNRSAARKRWKDFQGNLLNTLETSDANAMPNACQNDAPTPTPTPTPKKDSPLPPLFDKFWESFPRQRRGSRDKALIAYQSAIKKTTEEKIHAAVIRYSSCDDVTRGFAKGAAAWLNDDRWDDDPNYQKSRESANGKRTYGDSLEIAAEGARRILDEKERLRDQGN